MPSTLNLTANFLAFSDLTASSQPQRQNFNWTRQFQLLSVNNPRSNSFSVVAGATQTVFDGTESTSIDGTTAFAVTISPLDSSVYRFTNSAGTAPNFRTPRSISVANHAVTFARNTDQSVTVTVATPGNFSGATVGDVVFVPGTLTGDSTSPFNSLNTGFWVVNGVLSSTSLTLVRPASSIFNATSETVTPTLATQFQIFSAAGVQVGDFVNISAGFATSTQRTFTISQVTAQWFEVISTVPVALESGITPTASGMIFYNAAKQWMRIESDQRLVVRVNGDTNSFVNIAPIKAGDGNFPGWFELWGPIYKLVLVNKGPNQANVDVLSAE